MKTSSICKNNLRKQKNTKQRNIYIYFLKVIYFYMEVQNARKCRRKQFALSPEKYEEILYARYNSIYVPIPKE